jgi:hypothetical protein
MDLNFKDEEIKLKNILHIYEIVEKSNFERILSNNLNGDF